MDKRKLNGGARDNAGRKPKADEIKLIERLTPLADSAFQALATGLKEKNPAYVKMWFEYFYGKPKQQMDITSNGTTIQLPSWVNDKS